jgi:hypothetical protein
MDYLIEAQKFLQQARKAHNAEVIKTDLEMVDWFLARAIAERDEAIGQKSGRRESEPSAAKRSS